MSLAMGSTVFFCLGFSSLALLITQSELDFMFCELSSHTKV